VDTDAKARNLKRTEERILDHLNRTGALEDILKVEQELSRYREQIERLEGRLRFLENRVAFSTITVQLTESPKAESLVPPESFSTARVASEATRSLVRFAQALWARLIWIGIWAAVWVPLAIIVWLAARLARRRARRLRQASAKRGVENSSSAIPPPPNA
jgi:hypothetical protein